MIKDQAPILPFVTVAPVSPNYRLFNGPRLNWFPENAEVPDEFKFDETPDMSNFASCEICFIGTFGELKQISFLTLPVVSDISDDAFIVHGIRRNSFDQFVIKLDLFISGENTKRITPKRFVSEVLTNKQSNYAARITQT